MQAIDHLIAASSQASDWQPMTNKDHDLGAVSATAVDAAGQAVHADSATHVEPPKNLCSDLDMALRTNCLDHYAHKLAMSEIRKVLKRYWPCEPR